jgi:hypothetical protein
MPYSQFLLCTYNEAKEIRRVQQPFVSINIVYPTTENHTFKRMLQTIDNGL